MFLLGTGSLLPLVLQRIGEKFFVWCLIEDTQKEPKVSFDIRPTNVDKRS